MQKIMRGRTQTRFRAVRHMRRGGPKHGGLKSGSQLLETHIPGTGERPKIRNRQNVPVMLKRSHSCEESVKSRYSPSSPLWE